MKTLLIGLGGFGNQVACRIYREALNTCGEDDVLPLYIDMDPHDLHNEAYDNNFLYMGTNVRPIDIIKSGNPEGVSSWFPDTPVLLHSSMLGTGICRAMGRLCFETAMQNGVLTVMDNRLNQLINANNNFNDRIRVIIVTSLAGSFGSGAFIQTALYIRRFFERIGKYVNIIGQFVMPKVFIEGYGHNNISQAEVMRISANAYASLSELSYINRILLGKSEDVDHHFCLGSLFDSRRDRELGIPVFDSIYYFETSPHTTDVRNITIEGCMDEIASSVCARYFSPMTPDFDSMEDGTFLQRLHNGLTVNGTSSVSLVYPKDDILEYCAVRRISDKTAQMLSLCLDRSVKCGKELISNIDNMVKNMGDVPAVAEIKSFIRNEIREEFENGDVNVLYTDKTEDYFAQLDSFVDEVVSQAAPLSELEYDKIKELNITDGNSLESFVCRNQSVLEKALCSVKDISESIARRLICDIIPVDAEDVSVHKKLSPATLIHSGLAWADPVSAVYLLTKAESLADECLQGECHRSRIDEIYFKAVSTFRPSVDENNSSSAHRYRTESDPMKRLGMKPFLMPWNMFISEYNNWYRDYYHRCCNLIKYFVKISVKASVVRELSSFLAEMRKVYQRAFSDICLIAEEKVCTLAENNINSRAVKYIYGSKAAKEHIYSTLTEEHDNVSCELGRMLSDHTFRSVCEVRRCRDDFSVRRERSVIRSIFSALTDSVKNDIMNFDAHIIDIDVFSAIYANSDLASDVYSIDGAETEEERRIRHNNALISEINYLGYAANCAIDRYGQGDGDLCRRAVCFGYAPTHPDVDDIFADVGISARHLCRSNSYGINVLSCCKVTWGIKVSDINELDKSVDGLYIRMYEEYMDSLCINAGNVTPHLDKNILKFTIS